MAVVGYARVSSEEQAKEGHSLAAQRESIKAYCVAHRVEHLQTLSDDGISGGKTNRSALQRCLKLLESGEADGMVVTKLDRLARNTRYTLLLVDRFNDSGWTLHSIHERLDTSTAMGMFSLTIIAAIAEMERNQTAERTKMVLDHKRSKNEKLGGIVPYGYSADDQGVLIENPEQQAVIDQVLQWFRDGNSLSAIARELNLQGVPTQTGAEWRHVQVRRIVNKWLG